MSKEEVRMKFGCIDCQNDQGQPRFDVDQGYSDSKDQVYRVM